MCFEGLAKKRWGAAFQVSELAASQLNCRPLALAMISLPCPQALSYGVERFTSEVYMQCCTPTLPEPHCWQKQVAKVH